MRPDNPDQNSAYDDGRNFAGGETVDAFAQNFGITHTLQFQFTMLNRNQSCMHAFTQRVVNSFMRRRKNVREYRDIIV